LPAYDFTILNEHFYYDSSSKSGLKYKKDACHYSKIIFNKGEDAGFLSSYGYWKVTLKGIAYFVHRVIMVLMGNDVIGQDVDHIDRDRSNNNISNLRLVSNKQNMRNKSKYSSNTTGFIGVSVKYEYGVQTAIVATWRENGKHRTKGFSINKYGYDLAIEKAKAYRQAMLTKLAERGEYYSDQHWNKETK
jgi:hypothetical protein